MKHLTEDIPKPMVPVSGKPVLQRIVENLRDHAGVQKFFILVGYKAEVIQAHFGDGASYGVGITYGSQVVQDGTGRAVAYCREWAAGDPFMLSYGDILISPEEYGLCARSFDLDGFIAVKKMTDLSQGGAVSLDADGIFTQVIEKAKPGEVDCPWYNAGFYGMPGSVFDYINRLQKSPRGEYELTDALNMMAQAGLKLRGVELKQPWADVRDPEVLEELNRSGQWGSGPAA